MINGESGKPAELPAQEGLSENEVKYHTLFETMTLGVVYQGRDGRIIDANPAAQMILGLSLEQIQGRKSIDPRWKAIHQDGSDFPGETHPAMVALSTGIDVKNVVMGVYNPAVEAYRWINISAVPLFRSGETTPYQVYTTFEDITQRRWREDALRESEWRNRLVSEMMTDYIFIVDVARSGALSLRWASENMMRITGRTVNEAATQELWMNIIHPDDGPIFFGFIQQMLAGGQPGFVECRAFVKSGLERWIQVNAMPQTDESGTVVSIVGAIKDITERKRVELILRETEEQYRILLEESSDPIFSFSADGQYRYANRAFAAGVARPVEQVIGKRIWDVFPKEEADNRFAALSQVFRTGEEKIIEARVPRVDGDRYYMTTITPIKDTTGTVISVICSSKDISLRRRSEEALRESEEKFRRIVESSPMAMYLYRLERDGERLVLIGANPSADRMTGIRHQPLLGKTIEEAFPALTVTEIPTMYRKVARGESGPQSFEIPYADERFSGYYDVHVFQTSASQIAVEFVEISDRKRVEQEITEVNRQLEAAVTRANEMAFEAKAATIAKSRFLASMSHEIRTPLNAILGFSQLMQDDPEELSVRQKQRLETINRSGAHLLALLNDVLELSKIEAGGQHLTPTTFDLHALLGDLTIVFRQRAESRQLTFDLEGVEQVPQYIVTDEQKLRQVLINLLGNAVKFTQIGGVRLVAWCEPVNGAAVRHKPDEAEDLHLVILVEDTGPGIVAEEMERVFEAFEQARLGRNSGQGTGLGLAISRQFARLMGGDVTVKSMINQGSVFRFEIPVKVGAATVTAEITYPQRVVRIREGASPCKVLVVEDVQENRDLIVERLSMAGFEVDVAKNGLEALEKFSSGRPQLILMDQHMPEMRGDEAIRQIRHSPEGNQVKIITVTASATDESRDNALAAGADDFMMQPFRQSELFEKIRLLTGVQYLYAEVENPEKTSPGRQLSPALIQEMLAVLTPELRKQIQDAVIRGRQDHLLRLVQQVPGMAPEMISLLQELIAKFDYETLLQLLG